MNLVNLRNLENLENSLLLYAVSDRFWLGLDGNSVEEQVEKAIIGGATFIQLREKNLDYKEFYKEAENVRKICSKYNVPFVINDNVQLAKQVNANGVHLGQDDMNVIEARKILGDDAIIGVSAQTVEQAVLAETQGADYLGVGAIFSTSTKTDAENVSLKTLKEICKSVKIPVVAIGGINLLNLCFLRGTGIKGISVVSAIFGKKDITQSTKLLKKQAQITLNPLCKAVKGVIFDADGTLLDSLEMWNTAGARYLKALGYSPKPDLQEHLLKVNIIYGAKYMKEEYSVDKTIEEMIEGIKNVVKDDYLTNIQLLPGVRELLNDLKKNNIPMIIATGSDKNLVSRCLEKNNALSYFSEVLSTNDFNTDKNDKKIFEIARENLNISKNDETAVFEDTDLALEIAEKAGFITVDVKIAYKEDK